ncbi:MAG: primase-helicase family protein [Saprospiraceae bacterium]
MSDNQQELSFFESRMQLLGVTEQKNRITVTDPEAEFPAPERYETAFFTEEKSSGDIEIFYWTIEGEVIRYLQMSDAKTASLNAKLKYYKTRRLREPKGDMKYQMPAGQPTRPWFPPALVEAYRSGAKIETLFLTEGVFKAWKASDCGMMTVGLPSITCYKDGDGLYADVVKLIDKCQVQTVVVLWDGDCLQISSKDLLQMEDLTQRPKTFYASAKNIAQLVREMKFPKNRDRPACWFYHVKSDSFAEKPKGLDDLLVLAGREGEEKVGSVVKEALDVAREQNYFFYKKNISDSPSPLHKYFRLHSAEAFYDYHMERIGSKEWKFNGGTYKWDDAKDKLETLNPWWAKNLKWVGNEFFLEETVPGAVRDRRTLLHMNDGTCLKLFEKGFHKYVAHHKAFCNVPDHFNYRQVIERDGSKYYNRYFPFPHEPKEGKWDNVMRLIKHIFGSHSVRLHHAPDTTIPAWELGLDYVQLLLTKPTQVLPVLCLYSPENNTGKSTFGKLLINLFGDNAIQIGNADLENEFNEQYADKLVAICEETLLERKRDAERIKAMSTSDQISVNPKGQKQYTIDFFCKFVFTSNNIRMVYVNKHDERFWIIRVPVLPKDDPDFEAKMKAEIPAFVAHLKDRQMATKKTSRMWFHASMLRTPVFDEVVRVNEPGAATDLREAIRELFIQEGPDCKEIRLTLKEIKEEFFNGKTSQTWIQEVLKDYLNVDLVRDANGAAVFERGKYPFYETAQTVDGPEIRRVERPYRGRPYRFLREKFVDDSQTSYFEQPPSAAPAAPDWKTAAANAVEQEVADAELPF